MKLLKLHATVSTALLILLSAAAFTGRQASNRFDEITVGTVNVVDSSGRTRVILSGGFPPRRADLAGLLFINEDGHEAGGLVYRGTRDENGQIQAGAILTFDQYQNDQIVALQYDHTGSRKRQGFTIQERPDTLSDLLKEAYRAIETASSAAERDSLRRYYMGVIPREDLPARRLFLGRDYSKASVVTLSDLAGRPRLRLEVDSLGQATIAFLNADGDVTKVIAP